MYLNRTWKTTHLVNCVRVLWTSPSATFKTVSYFSVWCMLDIHVSLRFSADISLSNCQSSRPLNLNCELCHSYRLSKSYQTEWIKFWMWNKSFGSGLWRSKECIHHFIATSWTNLMGTSLLGPVCIMWCCNSKVWLRIGFKAQRCSRGLAHLTG